ncbi:Chromosome partition protein Smc [Streptomyces badius]
MTETGAGAHGRTESVTLTTTAPAVADLVRGPASLVGAVRRLVADTVVVATLEDAEELVAAHPGLTAVTGEGDVLAAHFAHGGSAGAPSLLEVQASVDEAAAELAELAVRCEERPEAQRRAGQRRTAAGRARRGAGGAPPGGRAGESASPSSSGGSPGRLEARRARPSA